MLGAAEFTMIGNVLMGIMAIGGMCAMLYAVGHAMTETPSRDWTRVGQSESSSDTYKKAA